MKNNIMPSPMMKIEISENAMQPLPLSADSPYHPSNLSINNFLFSHQNFLKKKRKNHVKYGMEISRNAALKERFVKAVECYSKATKWNHPIIHSIQIVVLPRTKDYGTSLPLLFRHMFINHHHYHLFLHLHHHHYHQHHHINQQHQQHQQQRRP